ncbi:hypothetical protein HQ560_18955, partial [bacterium]|nr:hypothetical protein [bacterium]
LHRLVCSARPPAQGYRLHPDVRVKGKPAPALAFHDDMDEFEACR